MRHRGHRLVCQWWHHLVCQWSHCLTWEIGVGHSGGWNGPKQRSAVLAMMIITWQTSWHIPCQRRLFIPKLNIGAPTGVTTCCSSAAGAQDAGFPSFPGIWACPMCLLIQVSKGWVLFFAFLSSMDTGNNRTHQIWSVFLFQVLSCLSGGQIRWIWVRCVCNWDQHAPVH